MHVDVRVVDPLSDFTILKFPLFCIQNDRGGKNTIIVSWCNQYMESVYIYVYYEEKCGYN